MKNLSFILLFFLSYAQAGDLVLNSNDKSLMVAIKTDEIGNTRVRVSAWMNAQHKKGQVICSLSGNLKYQNMKMIKFRKSLLFYPGENIPIHLGNFPRDFDPSKHITASAKCVPYKKRLKASKESYSNKICCRLGPYRTVCAEPAGGGEDDLSFDVFGEVNKGLDDCIPLRNL